MAVEVSLCVYVSVSVAEGAYIGYSYVEDSSDGNSDSGSACAWMY